MLGFFIFMTAITALGCLYWIFNIIFIKSTNKFHLKRGYGIIEKKFENILEDGTITGRFIIIKSNKNELKNIRVYDEKLFDYLKIGDVVNINNMENYNPWWKTNQ